MLVLSILSLIIGMSFLYFRLFKFIASEKDKNKEAKEYQINKISLNVLISLFLINGAIFLILSVYFGYDYPVKLIKLKEELLICLKIVLIFLAITGLSFTFFPEKQLNGKMKTGEVLCDTRLRFIKKTRRLGIICLVLTFFISIYLFF